MVNLHEPTWMVQDGEPTWDLQTELTLTAHMGDVGGLLVVCDTLGDLG